MAASLSAGPAVSTTLTGRQARESRLRVRVSGCSRLEATPGCLSTQAARGAHRSRARSHVTTRHRSYLFPSSRWKCTVPGEQSHHVATAARKRDVIRALPRIIDMQVQYYRSVPVGPARRPKSPRCGRLRGRNSLTLLVTVDCCSTPPTPGRRLGSGFARRSSPASKLKILPDSSLPAEGPAEAGTDCWAAAILAVTRSATSSLSYSAGADRHQPGDFRRVQSP